MLLEYVVNQQCRQTNQLGDLVTDLLIVGKDIHGTTVEALDNRMMHLDLDDVKGLRLYIPG